jgi:hypothetical protein
MNKMKMTNNGEMNKELCKEINKMGFRERERK